MTCWYPRCPHPVHREGVCLRHYCAWLDKQLLFVVIAWPLALVIALARGAKEFWNE